MILQLLSARNRNRTCTPLRKPDFESGASTNTAIRALHGCNITLLIVFIKILTKPLSYAALFSGSFVTINNFILHLYIIHF